MLNLHVCISVSVCRGWQRKSKAVNLEGKKHRNVVSAFGILKLPLFTYTSKNTLQSLLEKINLSN